MNQIIIDESADALAARVADALLAHLITAQAAGEVPHIGLTGGTIAERIHEELGRRGVESGVDWSRVVFWWGDERFVAADSPERNASQARTAFLDVVGATEVHEIPSTDDASDVDAAAAAYAAELREHGSGAFEVLMLGLGPDGHVASLFPGFGQLDVEDEVTVAVTGSPKPPPERVSLTFAALNRSRHVWFVVAGAEKAEAVRRTRADEGDLHETPARGVHGSVSTLWYVDRAAAAADPAAG